MEKAGQRETDSPTLYTLLHPLRLLRAAARQSSVLDDDDLWREVLLPDRVLSDQLAGGHPQPAAQGLDTAGCGRGASTVVRLKHRQSVRQTVRQ